LDGSDDNEVMLRTNAFPTAVRARDHDLLVKTWMIGTKNRYTRHKSRKVQEAQCHGHPGY
jgi:hypothetical protein